MLLGHHWKTGTCFYRNCPVVRGADLGIWFPQPGPHCAGSGSPGISPRPPSTGSYNRPTWHREVGPLPQAGPQAGLPCLSAQPSPTLLEGQPVRLLSHRWVSGGSGGRGGGWASGRAPGPLAVTAGLWPSPCAPVKGNREFLETVSVMPCMEVTSREAAGVLGPELVAVAEAKCSLICLFSLKE